VNSGPAVVGGIFDAAIGVTNLVQEISYWALFGYHEAERGRLEAAAARALYGVDSALTAVRLQHGESDHSYIRLMVWDRPLGRGLRFAPLRASGSRWLVFKTRDFSEVLNHCELSQDRGGEIFFTQPFFQLVPIDEDRTQPFRGSITGYREFTIFRPESRQVVFKSFGYDRSSYGTYDNVCQFRCTEFVHCGMFHVAADDSRVAFYGDVLGLKREELGVRVGRDSKGGRIQFPITESERVHMVDFCDRRTPSNDPNGWLPGRLKTFRLEPSSQNEDSLAVSRPGHLGVSLYTYRVDDIGGMHRKVATSGGSKLSAIWLDEFGARAFSFVAPDGYFWTLIEA
jgi:catechol 2,3-dioxygenase-like lactoylglutathione lyase family enzyme